MAYQRMEIIILRHRGTVALIVQSAGCMVDAGARRTSIVASRVNATVPDFLRCTKTLGQLDDAYAFYQPGFLTDFAINLVGREFKDPAYFTSPHCPSNFKGCRYSDSVFVEYDSGIAYAWRRTYETEQGNLINDTNQLYTILFLAATCSKPSTFSYEEVIHGRSRP